MTEVIRHQESLFYDRQQTEGTSQGAVLDILDLTSASSVRRTNDK